MNDEITLTQLTTPQIRKMFREELECFFADKIERRIDDDEIGGVPLAMEISGLAKATIYSRVSARTIPHRKQGKMLYFSRKELNDWINAGRRKTQAEISTEAENYSKTSRS